MASTPPPFTFDLLAFSNQWRLHSYSFLPSEACSSIHYGAEQLRNMALDVQAQNLYSYNKDHIDDLPTSTLKYLMLPFLLAECLDAQKATREERRLNLLAAKAHYQIFDAEIKSLTRDDSSFKKLNKDFAAGPASTEDPGSRRHFVITRRQTLSILEAELEKTAKYAFRPEESDSAEARAFWIDLLKLSLLETRANLELIEEELRMLNHAENIQNQDRDEKIDLNERKQLSVFKIVSYGTSIFA